jgi:two-component system response regulator YesN
MSQPEFTRAAQLLQVIVQCVETSSLADLQQKDLERTRRALQVLGQVHQHLRAKLNGALPAILEVPSLKLTESRPEQMVHDVLDRIYREYGQPLTLQTCAQELHVSPVYLSTLFSRLVGLPFKTCLTTVRMEKACELLSDPLWSISQVARAVGYASDNRFRTAFKKVIGVCPTKWRNTLRADSGGARSSGQAPPH